MIPEKGMVRVSYNPEYDCVEYFYVNEYGTWCTNWVNDMPPGSYEHNLADLARVLGVTVEEAEVLVAELKERR